MSSHPQKCSCGASTRTQRQAHRPCKYMNVRETKGEKYSRQTGFDGDQVTCSCPFMELRSSAFFSRDWTHTFLFCLQREAAARLRSRNLRRFSSGSSLVVLRRRPPVLGGLGAGATGEAWKITRVNSTFALKAVLY